MKTFVLIALVGCSLGILMQALAVASEEPFETAENPVDEEEGYEGYEDANAPVDSEDDDEEEKERNEERMNEVTNEEDEVLEKPEEAVDDPEG